MSRTKELSRWICDLKRSDIPEEVFTRARVLMLDGLGCLMVGSRLPWSVKAVKALTAFDPGSSFIAGWDRTAGPFSATLLNSSFVQGFELDDYFPYAPAHLNAILLPVLLGLASDRRVSGETALIAMIVGYEVCARVGMALNGPEMLSRGWHSGVVFGGPAAAATAGRILGLDAIQIEDAMGIGATQACGLMSAQYESMVKRMQHGFASRNGLLGAILARQGYVGIKDVFERDYGGFLSVFGEGHHPDADRLVTRLGERWCTGEVSIKTYAAMGGLHAAIDCARHLRERIDAVSKIGRIVVEVGRAAFDKGGATIERPIAPIGAQMSLRYAVAVALIDGDAMIAQFGEARLASDDVWALIERVEVRHQPDFDTDRHTTYTTRVTIEQDGAGSIDTMVDTPRGGTGHPLSNDEIATKFERLMDPIMESGRRDALRDAVLDLDRAPDFGAVLKLIAAPVRNALQ